MANDHRGGSTKMNTEMCRQMRNGQLHRFVRSLPAFSVDAEIPDRFAELLSELDKASAAAYEPRQATSRRQ